MARYWMTPTARLHVRRAIQETREKWGLHQAGAYRRDLQTGFQKIADEHTTFNAPHREDLAVGTAFTLHLVAHRYVAFQAWRGDVIIAGLFHERMDIPVRLQELQGLTPQEIDALKREIDAARRGR
ncbi:MAG: type II toxin-antitoxin system RelE/ParE family toxin [Burkholderiaceae bacterium]|jgi:plasmid stabilization system protein ParE|nr:type II toxin-antitoxin system RelE/ParE family toxin [Burkholderiaceae bacterium]MEB2319166.1 type II toxin-antitoxin system RelE/ParE family toxin [Pseudomonadota bacterium]